MSTCILVIGTPRSGTSCVAGILHHLGIFMGERLFPADELNPGGYYQDADFEQVCFDTFEARWPSFKTEAIPSEMDDKLKSLIVKRNESHELWGVKGNRLVHFLPTFKANIDNLKIIVTYRQHSNSVNSWKARVSFRADEAESVMNNTRNAIIPAINEIRPVDVLRVSFENVMSNPEHEVEQIANFCGLATTSDAVEWINQDWYRFSDG